MPPEMTETEKRQLDLLDALIENAAFMEDLRRCLTRENRGRRKSNYFWTKWYKNGAINQIAARSPEAAYSAGEPDLGAVILIGPARRLFYWDLAIFSKRRDYTGAVILISPEAVEGETFLDFTSISSPVPSGSLGTEYQTVHVHKLFDDQLAQLRKSGLEIVQRLRVPLSEATSQ